MAALRRIALAVAVGALAAPAAAAQTIPADTVAWVGETPILKTDFDHWYAIVLASADDPAPGEGEVVAYREQVMQLLVSHQWIRKEAAERGVRVSRPTVLRSFRRQKRASFPREADFRTFLRESGQTVGDIKLRVRMDLLSSRLRDRVVRGARTPAGQQRRLDRFVRAFRRKWVGRTVCGEGYATQDCGSTVPIAPG